jgi:hypothetical protein
LGAYNQIEIYPDVLEESEFLLKIETLLELTTVNEEDKNKFLNSIKILSEGNENYFQYNPMNLIFKLPINSQIEWTVDLLLWKNQKLKYEIRLGVLSESLLCGEYPKMLYKVDTIIEIEQIMMQINNQKVGDILLFTDEVSESNFINELEGKLSFVNFLFDLAILPSKLQWKINEDKYEMIEANEEFKRYRSKHCFMKF